MAPDLFFDTRSLDYKGLSKVLLILSLYTPLATTTSLLRHLKSPIVNLDYLAHNTKLR
jgi:hypothetical protein